jgi:hypothetical protein
MIPVPHIGAKVPCLMFPGAIHLFCYLKLLLVEPCYVCQRSLLIYFAAFRFARSSPPPLLEGDGSGNVRSRVCIGVAAAIGKFRIVLDPV